MTSYKHIVRAKFPNANAEVQAKGSNGSRIWMIRESMLGTSAALSEPRTTASQAWMDAYARTTSYPVLQS